MGEIEWGTNKGGWRAFPLSFQQDLILNSNSDVTKNEPYHFIWLLYVVVLLQVFFSFGEYEKGELKKKD